MRVHGGSGFGKALGVQGLMKKEEENKTVFPCCTSKGRRKGNSIVQNDIVLLLFIFLHETMLFHLNVTSTYLFPNQSLIYPLFF